MWASAAANMRTYHPATREGQGVPRRPARAGGARGLARRRHRRPTLAPGETYDDLVADVDANFDVEAAGCARLPLRAARPARDRAPARHRLTPWIDPRRRGRLLDAVVQGRRPRRATRARSCAPGVPRTRTAPRSTPTAWEAALRRRPSPTPAGSTTSAPLGRRRAAARHGAARRPAATSSALRCCGTTPARPTPPPTSSHELGAEAWADATGSVPVASFTVTKLRWIAQHDPTSASRTTAGLPAARLADLAAARRHGLTTDRGDASGTGYWSPPTGDYRPDLLVRAFGRDARGAERGGAVRRPSARSAARGVRHRRAARAGHRRQHGRGARASTRSPATSSCRSARAVRRSRCPRRRRTTSAGAVAGFADATGRFLPLVCTLNAAQVLDVDGPHARRRPRRLRRGSRCRRRPAPTASCCCRTSPASAPRTGPTPPACWPA